MNFESGRPTRRPSSAAWSNSVANLWLSDDGAQERPRTGKKSIFKREDGTAKVVTRIKEAQEREARKQAAAEASQRFAREAPAAPEHAVADAARRSPAAHRESVDPFGAFVGGGADPPERRDADVGGVGTTAWAAAVDRVSHWHDAGMRPALREVADLNAQLSLERERRVEAEHAAATARATAAAATGNAEAIRAAAAARELDAAANTAVARQVRMAEASGAGNVVLGRGGWSSSLSRGAERLRAEAARLELALLHKLDTRAKEDSHTARDHFKTHVAGIGHVDRYANRSEFAHALAICGLGAVLTFCTPEGLGPSPTVTDYKPQSGGFTPEVIDAVFDRHCENRGGEDMLEINTLYHRMMRTAKMPGQMSIAAAEADYIRGLERRLQEAKRLSEAAPPFQRR